MSFSSHAVAVQQEPVYQAMFGLVERSASRLFGATLVEPASQTIESGEECAVGCWGCAAAAAISGGLGVMLDLMSFPQTF